METVFETAARVSTPIGLAAFCVAAILFTIFKKRGRIGVPLGLAILTIFLLGLAALLAPVYLQSHGVYRVRVIVVGADQLPVDNAEVTSSMGGEPKRVSGGWEFDIPAASRPVDGKLALYAAVRNAFLKGRAETVLSESYNLTVTIHLSTDESAVVRGIVKSPAGDPVAGARVGVVGHPSETVATDRDGNFVIGAHVAENQQVEIFVEKTGYQSSTKWCQAGNFPATLVIDPVRVNGKVSARGRHD